MQNSELRLRETPKKNQLGLSVARSEEDYNELQKTIPKIIGLTLLV